MTLFDTLSFSNRLKEAGVSAKVAEAHTNALTEVAMTDLATKTDLDKLKSSLIIWLGTMVFVAVGLVAAIVRLLPAL